MIQDKSLEFVSRYCRQGPHAECNGIWTGLGFIINCSCVCHKQKVGVDRLRDQELRLTKQSHSSGFKDDL